MKEQCTMNKRIDAFCEANTHKEISEDRKYVPVGQNTQWKS